MNRARIYVEGACRSYSVWTDSPITGDKKDCLGSFQTKRAALRAVRKHNRVIDAKETA
jgi:hypothetical protein